MESHQRRRGLMTEVQIDLHELTHALFLGGRDEPRAGRGVQGFLLLR